MRICNSRHGKKTAASGHGGVIRGSEGVRFGALARVIRQVGVGPEQGFGGPRLSRGVGRVVARGLV